MPFTDRFQLLDLKRDEGARTYEAREIATGRPVYVHVFANCKAPLNRVLLQKLDTLPEDEGKRIIERGDHEAGVYLVTDRLAEYPGLSEWLQAKSVDPGKVLEARGAWQLKPPVPPQGPSPFDTAPIPALEPSIVEPPRPIILGNTSEQTLRIPTPIEPPKDPGEFTRQFAPPVLRPEPKAPPVPPSTPASDPGEFTRQFAPPVLRPAPKEAPPAPSVPAADPGEFTRQFAPPVLRPTPPPPPPPVPGAKEPGEFTRMFSAPASPPKPASPPTGDFTKLFQSQRPGSAPAPRVPAQQPGAPPTQPPGEFTQMLQAQRPVAPAAPQKQAGQAGEFTRFFQSPMAPSQQAGQGNSAPFTPPRPPQPKDAGEFTQIFGKGELPSAPPPPAPAAPPNLPSANATQAFATPRTVSHQPIMPPNMGSPMAQPPMHAGPSEYTQMFAKPASLTFGQAQPNPQIPRSAEPVNRKRNNSRLPLLLLMGAVLLLIVAIVVFFVMRPRTT